MNGHHTSFFADHARFELPITTEYDVISGNCAKSQFRQLKKGVSNWKGIAVYRPVVCYAESLPTAVSRLKPAFYNHYLKWLDDPSRKKYKKLIEKGFETHPLR
jgi:hypothetical protein